MASRTARSSLIGIVVLPLALAAFPAGAQLDASCTVAALNRSARVNEAGVWVLPNVPASTGSVRVRATCVADDGSLRSGQSQFFVIPANGVVPAPEIVFDAPEPVPATLELTAQVASLTAVGEVAQLTATASFADGTSEDVTAGTAGTNYRSSNPSITSVSLDGAVTAHVSGNVLVSAVNEGALAVLRLSVVLSGDTDGDGLPDDFELANGLDPNDPRDILDDQDGDGLSTADEFGLGLDPFDADTDNDGLLDGEEVTVVGTDPLVFDTDGDGVSDGLEVSSGSDPLDPASFNLAPILDTLEVYPAAFEIVFNMVEGEASRRLDVTGRLVDGTLLDLRSSRYGTIYASSDLAVASFGSEDGRVFAGLSGTATVTVVVAGVTATSEVSVTSFAPTALAYLQVPGFPNGVDVENGYVYVASGDAGLLVYDAFDPEAPRVQSGLDTAGNANDLRVEGRYVYLADGEAGLAVIDVADPTAPFLVGSVDTPGIATDVTVAGDVVFVADGAAGVSAVDVSNPASPVVVGSVATPGVARGIDAVDDLVVVADSEGGVAVVDASDPTALEIVGSTHTRGTFSRAADVVVRQRTAYVADGGSSLGGLRVIDFSQPSTPVVVGSTTDAFGLVGVALEDRFAVTADYLFVNAVPIFDVGGLPPSFNGILDFSGPAGSREDSGSGVAVEAGVVYMVGSNSVTDNGVRGFGHLHIGRYRRIHDGEGVAPEVAVVEPSAGSSATERRRLTVRAEASDDIEVASVRFLVDSEVVSEDFRAPYEAEILVPVGVASIAVGAEAEDRGGNVGSAEPVEILVIADDRPVVELLSPNAATRLVEGGSVEVVASATDDSTVAEVEILIDGTREALLSEPPYRIQRPLALGTTSIIVEVRAQDDFGQSSTTSPVAFPVAPDQPPTVEIVQPSPGGDLVLGSQVRVVLGVDDDLGVARAVLSIDGIDVAEDEVPPYVVVASMPDTGTEIRLRARAEDSRGQAGSSPESVHALVPDPKTQAVGTVELAGVVVAAATVECAGVIGVTGGDGTFSILNVPTLDLEVSCAASFIDAAGTTYAGVSAAVVPVRAGVTDVGRLRLTQSVFDSELGVSLNVWDDYSTFRDLRFPFPFFGNEYTTIWINSNGNITFVRDSPIDSSEDRDQFISGQRNTDGNVGPAIALLWHDLAPIQSGDFGFLGPGELDFFTFEGAAGDVVTAEILADRMGSLLNSVLTLYDSTGTALAFNDDYSSFNFDSRITISLPADGTYYLQLEDYNRYGRPGFPYRISLDDGTVPVTGNGFEQEPNDDFATATPISYGDSLYGVIDTDFSEPTRNVYLNDRTPGQVVVTWSDVPQYPAEGSNTARVALYEDGRIEFGFNGITVPGALVGLSPSNGAAPLELDFTADAPISSSGAIAVFELFDDPATHPFDLDGGVIDFTPNAGGGFDVEVSGIGTAPGTSESLNAASSRATAEAAIPATGTVRGQAMPDGTTQMAGYLMVVTSSGDPSYRAEIWTDSYGRFEVHEVPVGGVRAVLRPGDGRLWQASGLLAAGSTLELKPKSIGPKPKR